MTFLKKIADIPNKNIKLFFYLRSFFRLLLIPNFICRRRLPILLNTISKFDENYIFKRVNYYNKLSLPKKQSENFIRIKDFKLKNKKSTYFFDTYQYIRFFNTKLRFGFLFGDITFVPDHPSIVKSRPINDENENSVLLNLDKNRHFNFIKDPFKYDEKKDLLIWRGHISIRKKERIDFLKKYYGHPYCNIGYTNNWNLNPEWAAKPMTIREQLKYKFILCIEGNDVATNLKWVMSSNSLPVMPKPRFETWFMEGKLIPGVHYVLIKDDFSDLEEQMNYYINNPSEALKIVENGHQYVNQFKNRKRENLISLLVLKKYFEYTGQI